MPGGRVPRPSITHEVIVFEAASGVSKTLTRNDTRSTTMDVALWSRPSGAVATRDPRRPPATAAPHPDMRHPCTTGPRPGSEPHRARAVVAASPAREAPCSCPGGSIHRRSGR